MQTKHPYRRIRVGIFHPADPVGPIPGGIDTVIRGVIKHAPRELEYTVFGATTDVRSRPIGIPMEIEFRDHSATFVPIVAADPTAHRSVVPLSLRYIWRLMRAQRSGLLRSIDIFDFHRVEPLVAFRFDGRPKNLMLHQDMAVIREKNCDIGWKYAPWAYEQLEGSLFRHIDHVFCVRQTAIDRYRLRFPQIADNFSFIPTWFDPDLFCPSDDSEMRLAIRWSHGIPGEAKIAVLIGRLDHQKDPLLALDAFALARQRQHDLYLLIIGDGVLRPQIEARIRNLGLVGKAILLGAQPPGVVARTLQGCDLLLMSSAYEGMPIVMLEALATGMPVVATDVGEVSRVVKSGQNGMVVQLRTAESLAAGLCATLAKLEMLRGAPCEQASRPYHPESVLGQIYRNHLAQAASRRS